MAEAPISAGRQCERILRKSLRGQPGRGAGRVDLLLRDAARTVFGSGKQSGTQQGSTQEGPRNIGRLLRGISVPTEAGLDGKEAGRLRQRAGPGSQGSTSVGAVRWEATPELVSQDREAGPQPFRGARSRLANTGISFARRSGGWQRCRPPFLLWPVFSGARHAVAARRRAPPAARSSKRLRPPQPRCPAGVWEFEQARPIRCQPVASRLTNAVERRL